MKKIILIIATLAFTSCQYTPCTNYKVEHKVVEKFHTQSRGGENVYYKLLFDNGEVESVESDVYARNNVGDVWVFNECK
jgi:hypothetical protein